MIYLYDGHFDGFLTCIYHHYYTEKVEGIYESISYEPVLFESVKYVTTDSEKSDIVHDAILEKFSEHMYFDIYHTFLSNVYDKDTLLLKYLKIAFKHGWDTDCMRTLDGVYEVQKIARQVGFEKHRFLGLLRFSDLGEYLYARFEPDHNIITLLADHFSDRFKNEKFIIQDVKRKVAIIGYEGQWLLTDFDKVVEASLLDEEIFFRTLWQQYFDSIGIEGRFNPKLQQSFVPLKYRKHLIEFGQKK
jgi:probable DNA metabolism protein